MKRHEVVGMCTNLAPCPDEPPRSARFWRMAQGVERPYLIANTSRNPDLGVRRGELSKDTEPRSGLVLHTIDRTRHCNPSRRFISLESTARPPPPAATLREGRSTFVSVVNICEESELARQGARVHLGVVLAQYAGGRDRCRRPGALSAASLVRG